MYDMGGGLLLNRKGIIPVFVVTLTILIMLISIGYAALNQNLNISGEAFLRAHGNVRITGIKSSSSTSEGFETYTPEYSKKGTKTFTTLPNSSSSVTYTIQMNNTTGAKYKFDSVTVSNTNQNVECIPSVAKDTIIEMGVSSFTIEVKYKSGVAISEKTDVCEIKYEFSIFDVTPPTLSVSLVSSTETTRTVKIIAEDDTGGSGLSEDNVYKYYFSTSKTNLEGGEWKDYTSGEEIVLEGKNQEKYLWIYPVKDKAGNINDGKTNISDPYIISQYSFASIYTLSYNTNGRLNYFTPDSNEITYNSFTNKDNDCIGLGTFTLYDLKANDRIKLAFTIEYSNIEVDTSQKYENYGQGSGSKTAWSPGMHFSAFTINGSGTYNYEGYVTLTAEQAENASFYMQLRTDYIKSGTIKIKNIKMSKETIVSNQVLKYGSNIPELPTATNIGYTFAGWYTSPTEGVEVNLNTTVPASDTTYYAHWNPNSYTISYNGYYQLNYFVADSNEITYNSFTNKDNDCIGLGTFTLYDLKANDRIKLAFTLEYSNIEVDTSQKYENYGQGSGSKTAWSPGMHFSAFTINGSGTYNYEGYVTLTAEQAENASFYMQLRTDYIKSGTIKIKNIRITKETAVNTQVLQVESNLTNLPTPTHSDYDFIGWYTETNGGRRITNDSLVPPKDTTYYAQWTFKKYTVTYNGNKFSTTPKVENGLTISYDQDTSILTLSGSPTTNSFALMLIPQTFYLNEQYKITLEYISGDITCADNCVLATDVNKSSGQALSPRYFRDVFLPTPTDRIKTNTLPINDIAVSEGNELSTWLWIGSTTGTSFSNYKIKVNLTKVETIEVRYKQPYGTLGSTPTRKGYIFEGWYTSEVGGTKVTSDTIVSTASDHTLYAHWQQCQAGYYAGIGATSCSICPAGTYSQAGSSSCSTCWAGTYSQAGSSSCSTCSAGKYSSSGASSCSTCQAGTYSSSGASSCSTCWAGTYSQAGASSCTTCPSGQTSDAGASSCYTPAPSCEEKRECGCKVHQYCHVKYSDCSLTKSDYYKYTVCKTYNCC